MILRRVLVPAVASLVCCIAFPLFADTQMPLISVGTASTGLGNSVNIPVSISSVTDLYDFQFNLSFDPTLLQLQDVVEGTFLKCGEGGCGPANSTIFFPGVIDNTAGTVTFVVNTLVGPVSGQSGAGPLAVLTFQAVGLGVSPLDLSGVILEDSNPTDIQFTTSNGSVTVGAPEPVECTWMVPLLAFLWLWHKERAYRSGT